MNYQEQVNRMCSILSGCIKMNRELLDYWREKCSWPEMTLIREAIYAFNAIRYETEISRLEESLRLWISRKEK